MTEQSAPGSATRRQAIALVLLLVGVKVLLHLVLIGRYGYHRDEFYFIQCGEYLAFGYVDHAPLVPWLARVAGLFDHHIAALRMPSVIAGAASVALTMRLTREWGGGLFARGIAGTAVIAAPAYLRMGKILCIPVFEPVWWTLAALLLSRSARDGNPRRWLLVGVVAGLGLLTKHTMLFWGAGIAVAVAMTPSLRTQLKTPWPWLGGGVAALLFAPNIAWQVANGWPTLAFMSEMRGDTLAAIPKPLFLAGQLIYMNPIATPLWLVGLWSAFRRTPHPARPFAILFLVVCALLLLLGGKPYYLAPAYPPIFAAGAMAVERWVRGRSARRIGTVIASVGAVLFGIGSGLPILPLPTIERSFDAMVGWAVPPVALTHDLRDEHGWRELSETVAGAYSKVAGKGQGELAILTGNYGEASSLRFYSRDSKLPPAVSGHMSYHLWGPPDHEPTRLLVLGFPESVLSELCTSSEIVARNSVPLAHPFEGTIAIYYCPALKRPLSAYWPKLRRYAHGAMELKEH